MANILVVDDEESIGEVVELNLTLEGHRVKDLHPPKSNGRV